MSLVEKQRRQAILQHQYAVQQQQLQQQLQQQQLSAMYQQQQQQQQQQLLRHMGHPMMVQQQFLQPSAFGSVPSGGIAEDKSLPQQLGHLSSLQRVNQEYPSFQAGQAGILGSSGLTYGVVGAGTTYYSPNGTTVLGQGGGGSSPLHIHPGQPSQESGPPGTMKR